MAEATLKTIDQQIHWVLGNAQMSDWLKQALRAAMDRDPLEVTNDLEILNILLRRRCQVLIDDSMASYSRRDNEIDG